ncbi:MAG: c-type cytochrome, partial [Verrucomicrobiae bacterium]|nr:c-type cytochrome [Verrucomicrobiae bacterium]
DIWDYDNPPPPNLVTINHNGKKQDAVVQFTKMGFTFVLDRDTGEPLFPVVELPVPRSTIEGEETWPTQPFPVKPQPLTRTVLTDADLTRIGPENYASAKRVFDRYETGPLFTPPSERGTIEQPGTLGGVEWHGSSYDPYSNVIYVNSNDSPGLMKLKKSFEPSGYEDLTDLQRGRIVYERNCTGCHGPDRMGIPPIYPSVLKLDKTEEEIGQWIRTGGNIMPGFPHLSDQQIADVSKYMASDSVEPAFENTTRGKTRYLFQGYGLLSDHEGYPIISPPWGTLNAIDLATGDFLWRVPLGEFPELVERGIRNTGTPNFGGAVSTAGGVIFIAATADEKIRAFEKSRGELLWEYKLPAGG